MVRTRKVFIKSGYAYVTIMDFNSILINIFRTKLSLNLTVCYSIILFCIVFEQRLLIAEIEFKVLSRQIRHIEEDQRINDLLAILRERNVGNSYNETESREHLTAESLDQVSV